jgi:DNA-binding MarR family transcriptional regulator
MEHSHVHFTLMTAFHGSNRLMQKAVAKLGLFPGQPKILETLLAEDGLTPKVIGKRCVLDQSTVTSLLKKLEARGLMRREVHEEDRRSVRIFLTAEGRKIAEAVAECGKQVDAAIFRGMTENEKALFLQLLEKVNRNMEAENE